MFNYSKNSILACKLDTKNCHIIKCPKQLPCGYTACYDCIVALICDGGNRFQCLFCKKVHRIPKDLARNVSIEHALENSLEILVHEFSLQLKNDAINLKETLVEYEKNIEDIFEFISQDIEISVESMKLEIDNLKDALFDKTCKIRENYVRKSNRKMMRIERLILDVKKNGNIYVSWRNTSMSSNSCLFTQSEQELASSKLVGTLNGSRIGELVDVKELQISDIKSVRLKFHPFDLCNCFDEHLAISDCVNHKIYLFNKKFQPIKSIVSISNEYFNTPRGLCTNKVNFCVYLCDSKNQRILVIDKEFQELKRIIKNSEHIEEPQSICCDAGNNVLFVLDSLLKKIIKLSLNGDFLSKFPLLNSQEALIKSPQCMQLIDNCKQIAVNSNRERIYFYNLNNGDIEDILEFDSTLGGLFYTNDGYLFTHQAKGLLTCYSNSSNTWSILFERMIKNTKIIDYCCTGTWSICDFNKHLVLSLWNKSIVVV